MITHLACVMDGNRRWATQQGQLPWLGHKAGVATVEMVIKFALQHGISYLSLYTFSLENFNRSLLEQSYLFEIIVSQAEKKIELFIQQNVKIKFLGQLSKFPENIQAICQRIEHKTAQGNALHVNFLFGYGGRQEIFNAAQSLCQQAIQGKSVSLDLFESHLLTTGMPDPDLIIRTGGVQRLSNFLLYQSAYAEIRFLDTLWPDLTEQQLLQTVVHAVQAQKNLGK
ncbi:polyprenyl diphosphate synthase [Candidatus Chromulinivorax destructor]|uniref:Isoprenyl transferase n=1 Tax=Candidatus Chromulinivorax destructor TaxID=2066483 RepID=A0A345ZB90_9BACT|nr:polyprenyl diphosphate synthase [Candidatus Chromulinivorax destructor]AXK60557.1 di-trans,poly-cis-decaprenylcistransferase [Candidatus Chromulinivorax destructor]